MKKFVVMEQSYRYDDENYNKEEGGEPKKIFAVLSTAQAYKRELTIKKLKALLDDVNYQELPSYGSDWQDFSSVRAFDAQTRLNEVGIGVNIIDDEVYDWDFSKLTEKQLGVVADLFDRLEFYTIVDVECDNG